MTDTSMATVTARPHPKVRTLRSRLFLERLSVLDGCDLALILPEGERHYFGDKRGPDTILWYVREMNALHRMFLHGLLGFAEGYMANEWDTTNLRGLLQLLQTRFGDMKAHNGLTKTLRSFAKIAHKLRANTRSGSKRNIAAHYDLGNDFYDHWLDSTMTYSSAVFEQEDEELAAAQIRKYQRICEKLQLTSDHHVLEIGCGWGGFASYAAREFGCKITGVTLSQEQLDFAQERMESEGLSEQVDLQLCDYRDVEGQFDRVVSVEMFEAVGKENWETFFKVLTARLKPGGEAMLQIITLDDPSYSLYDNSVDFIQKYIFPGGRLPSPAALQACFSQAGLREADTFWFGPSYAKTLALWAEDFSKQWKQIEPLGFDERFKRMWLFYLAYCEAGFEHGDLEVGQFHLTAG
jgi:cyclopropane-fatty-acyl-phospholipid synthase